jgi:hypothetical protein
MKEDGARRLALVRAIESADPAEALLTRDDRLYATGAALAEINGDIDGRRDKRRDDQLLERRSALAYDRLAARYPAVLEADRRVRWPSWLNWALPIAALGLGIASNAVDGRRLSIIAFPMLGMVLWNLVIYVLLILKSLRRLGPAQDHAQPHPLTAIFERVAGAERAAASNHQPLGGALIHFVRDWMAWSVPLTNGRAARVLNLSAAAVAVGLLIGMYLRALGTEYRAGWESTLLGPEAVHALIHFMLWPASLVTGVQLPDVSQVQALRWAPSQNGENAGPWLHLYAASAVLVVILPRLVMASWNALRVARLQSHFPIPGQEDFYVRRLIRSVHGGASVIRIVPYSFHPPERARRQLERVVADVLGERTRVALEPPIPYGGEDEWLEGLDLVTPDADHLIVLFSLSATPEAENHGALVTGIRRRIAEAKSGADLAVLLDESGMRQRLGEGADERIQSRQASWETMLRQYNCAPLSLNLNADAASLARPVETALLHAPAGSPA